MSHGAKSSSWLASLFPVFYAKLSYPAAGCGLFRTDMRAVSGSDQTKSGLCCQKRLFPVVVVFFLMGSECFACCQW